MKIFLCEIKKIMSFRVFWIIFVCLLAVNGYVQIDRINDRYYPPDSYRDFFDETKDMSLDEIQSYTNELLEKQNNGQNIKCCSFTICWKFQKIVRIIPNI